MAGRAGVSVCARVECPMGRVMTIAELIEALAAATGPSRELDEAIMGHLGLIPALGGYYGWERTSPGYFSRPTNGEGSQFENAAAALYTSSVDAALTLVPAGLAWTLYSDGSGEIGPEPAPGRLMDAAVDFEGETPALGICIGALKARARVAK